MQSKALKWSVWICFALLCLVIAFAIFMLVLREFSDPLDYAPDFMTVYSLRDFYAEKQKVERTSQSHLLLQPEAWLPHLLMGEYTLGYLSHAKNVDNTGEYDGNEHLRTYWHDGDCEIDNYLDPGCRNVEITLNYSPSTSKPQDSRFMELTAQGVYYLELPNKMIYRVVLDEHHACNIGINRDDPNAELLAQTLIDFYLTLREELEP